MAAEERSSSKNLLCLTCQQNAASHFCVCDIEHTAMCDNCIPTHLKVSSKIPHSIHPIEYQESSKDSDFLIRQGLLPPGKTKLDEQVGNVLKWKDHFKARAKDFKKECSEFQKKMEASFDTLHKSLSTCVDEGIQEVGEHIKEPAPSYTNPVALRFWSSQGKRELLKQIGDVSEVFEDMKRSLSESKVALEVKCPNILQDFDEANFVLLREENEVKAYMKDKEEKERDKGFEQRKIPENAENREKEQHMTPSIFSLVKQCFSIFWRRVRAQPIHYSVILTIILLFMIFPYLRSNNFTSLAFTNPKLGPYNEEPIANLLISTGPIYLEAGYYKGQWEPSDKDKPTQESHISGYGSMAYHNGDIYEGFWKKGLRHGSGRLITVQGDIYDGMWLEGDFSGWGSCLSSSGIMMKGNWRGWRLQGFGQIIEGNSISIGEFKENKMSGMGLKYLSAFNFIFGRWHNGTVMDQLLKLLMAK